MAIHAEDGIQAGWEVFARDGTPAGTIVEIDDEKLVVRAADSDAAITVARTLVMEAHGGRVELDASPQDLGITATTDQTTAPTRDPGAPPKPATTPEQIRRLTGG